jgi:RES domain-containing protein
MRAYRIADRRFPLLDGAGAGRFGARWNSPGRPVVYAAQTFSGAMLEILVHASPNRLPKDQVHIEIEIPDRIACERFDHKFGLGLELERQADTRRFGDLWLEQSRTLVLIVPNVVTNGVETNILLNPLHPDFSQINASEARPVIWDSRLFS